MKEIMAVYSVYGFWNMEVSRSIFQTRKIGVGLAKAGMLLNIF